VDHAPCKLNNCLFRDGLEEFQLFTLEHVDRIEYSFSLHTFTPLMRFFSLNSVELALFCMSLLDDDEIGSIVKSWPYLERLNLGTTSARRGPRSLCERALVLLQYKGAWFGI
jgi:hypothetical protein